MLNETPTRIEYDLPTAVTFLLAGLALGATLVVLFSPRQENSDTIRWATNPPSHRVRRRERDEVFSE
jgi:hypothetical protein